LGLECRKAKTILALWHTRTLELGWPEGTVKSTAARALAQLRALSGGWDTEREEAQ
jgi:hypothetical protein